MISHRSAALEQQGVNRRRPLWASNGVKDPNLTGTLCVAELVVPGSVKTVPEKTLQAFADHGDVASDRVSGTAQAAERIYGDLEKVGIDFDDVVDRLEKRGLQKLDASCAEFVGTVRPRWTTPDAARRTQLGLRDPVVDTDVI